MKKQKLILEQLDRKIVKYKGLEEVVVPSNGWIYSMRQAINMSLRQLGNRLSITPQSVKEIEEREKNRTVSLKVLQQVASALNMKFVYGFIPPDSTFEKMIEKRANEVAILIVQRTSINMSLEDQKNSEARIKRAIKDKTEEIKNELPKFLWD